MQSDHLFKVTSIIIIIIFIFLGHFGATEQALNTTLTYYYLINVLAKLFFYPADTEQHYLELGFCQFHSIFTLGSSLLATPFTLNMYIVSQLLLVF